MVKEIQKCDCGEKLLFVTSHEIKPGLATNTYMCCKCNISYTYSLVYPLVHYPGQHSPTLYALISTKKLEE